LDMREKGAEGNDLLARLGGDARLGLSAADLDTAVGDPRAFVGAAGAQVAEITRRVDALVAEHPDAAAYTPSPIL
jgi:adenylosuccinate lyase